MDTNFPLLSKVPGQTGYIVLQDDCVIKVSHFIQILDALRLYSYYSLFDEIERYIRNNSTSAETDSRRNYYFMLLDVVKAHIACITISLDLDSFKPMRRAQRWL